MQRWLASLGAKLFGWAPIPGRMQCRQKCQMRLQFEQLEDRMVPATFLVREIVVGRGHSSPESFAGVNGTLFFTAYHPSFGREL
ncbi:MAG: hypothetical protein RMI91_02770 [Gemmatales bacterium]|nr:hypothetical protein [Gemmatales bacterium]MDW7993551.1 hypothetical protein [Gemmatales bacterium]